MGSTAASASQVSPDLSKPPALSTAAKLGFKLFDVRAADLSASRTAGRSRGHAEQKGEGPQGGHRCPPVR